MNKTVPIKESIKWGWYTFKNNAGFLVGITFLVMVVSGAVGGAISYMGKTDPQISSILQIIWYLVIAFVSLGVIKIYLTFCDSQKPTFGDLFSQGKSLINYIIATILYYLIVLVGLVLLVIPGIVWGIKYHMYPYLIVDKGMGPIEALKKSGEITKGVKVDLFLFGIVSGLIILAGVIVVFVGLFAAIPVTELARTYIYRHILYQTEVAAHPELLNQNPTPPAQQTV